MHTDADIAIIGAGAAGLFASIWAGREPSQRHDRQGAFGTPIAGDLETNPPSRSRLRLVALDGAKKLGAKILVAGGGGASMHLCGEPSLDRMRFLPETHPCSDSSCRLLC